MWEILALLVGVKVVATLLKKKTLNFIMHGSFKQGN